MSSKGECLAPNDTTLLPKGSGIVKIRNVVTWMEIVREVNLQEYY